MTELLNWVTANPTETALIVGGILSALSAALEATGKTGASKVVGTVTLDAGRVLRYVRILRAVTRR